MMKILTLLPFRKAFTNIFLLTVLLTGIAKQTEAQFFDRMARHAESKVKSEADRRAQQRLDKGIDKGFDAVENKVDGKGNETKKSEKESGQNAEEKQDQPENKASDKTNNVVENPQESKEPTAIWNKFDFVPGDVVIFEDGPGADEENGEFPSRWDLVKGQVEIATVNGENVIMFIDGQATIVPYLKNAQEDYLPEVFTIEFDFYKPKAGNRISVYLYDYKNQKKANSSMYMDIGSVRVSEKLADISGEMPGINYSNIADARWIHISIAFTKGKLKVYMNDTRLINIPHYSGNPAGLTLQAYFAELKEDKAFYFKNIRIAKGGVKYYDRVLSEGKIIVNGIKFDVNKATLKPESMGPINEIYDLMVKNPSVNFSVEGHTDSDGDLAANQSLSEARAKTVMDQLVRMGINTTRLKSTGWGESKPIAENSTPEGKANNRRVEFVKF